MPAVLREGGCKVASGEWVDPYSGRKYFRADELEVDHVVPLKEAHVSGGYAWPINRKRMFAEEIDGGELVLVGRDRNKSKGSQDPGKGWVPTDDKLMCAYLDRWVSIKRKWSPAMDPYEATMIRVLLKRC